MTGCAYTVEVLALADGEITGPDEARVRDHLASCEACQRELADALQLVALHAAPAAPADATQPGAPAKAIVPLDAARRRRRIGLAVTGAGLAAAAAAVVVIARPGRRTPAPRAPAIALAPHRGVEARIAWPPAAGHRPYDVERGGGELGREAIPLTTLAELERVGDHHALGALSLLAGDTARAATYLADGRGPDLDADRAALALVRGDAETALTLADAALAVDPDHPAARWNEAIALRELGLARAAAEVFRTIADSTDPRDTGWADEARARAAALTADADARAAVADRVLAGGAQLVQTGAGLSADDARAAPGLARLYLYDALRAAPDAARARALRPLADVIDAASGDTGASHAVDRVAAADFTRRAPLARTYAAIARGEVLTAADRAQFLARLRTANQPDLLIGALVRLGPDGRTAAAGDLPGLRAAAAALADPWFDLLAIEQDATRRISASDPAGAEAELVGGLARCALPYRCAKLAAVLARMYIDARRFADARDALVSAWRTVATTGDGWLLEQELAPYLATVHADRDDARGSGLALVRGYTREVVLRRGDACDVTAWAHALTATVLINRVQIDAARRELAAGRCTPHVPIWGQVLALAHVVRDAGTDDDRAALAADLAALRADPSLPAGERAMLDHSEGRAIIDRDPAHGEALLRAAIRTADAAPDDAVARKARAYSYSVLALSAAAHGDADRTLATLGEEAGLAAGPCTLGLAVEDSRWLAVARGADGRTRLDYGADRSTASSDAARVSPELLAGLAGCAVVDVLARPPLEGTPDLLPADRAWRFRIARPRPLAAPTGTAPRRVIVSDARPPAALALPALAPWAGATAADVVSGTSATPDRVLAALGDATWAELHVHGVVAAGASEASYLALSPDATGRYALSARDVRAADLRAAPVVVLAACRGAKPADLVDEAWSLPAAFVAAGARAVIASDAPIPDADAAALFADLRARVENGAAPAAALYAVRTAWRARGAAWVDHLMVFE